MGLQINKSHRSHPVKVAGIRIGGDSPVVIQSMTDTSTNDIEGSVEQIIRLAKAGASMVRLTAQGLKEVESLRVIKEKLRAQDIHIPIVADIHFNTKAAFAAAEVVDKVRINPGNFIDPGRVFKQIDYTDEEYALQLERLNETLEPFYRLCSKNGVAVRIGVNHGSLSDRIMSRFGNTPEGMVESAMEFLRIAKKIGFNDIVISIKASNTIVMVETVRLLAKKMKEEGMTFPLHLGVTEAGEGEDGRIKSAVGIGTLLLDGIGDTIRVSLSEDPVNEIPVAAEIINHVISSSDKIETSRKDDLLSPVSDVSIKNKIDINRNTITPIVITENFPSQSQIQHPDFTDTSKFTKISFDNRCTDHDEKLNSLSTNDKILLTCLSPYDNSALKNFIRKIRRKKVLNPIVLEVIYPPKLEKWRVTVQAAIDFGSLLMDNYIDGVMITASQLSPEENSTLAFGILQGTRKRITRTEYISCPGCGRTLFNLSPTIAKVKEATSHLKGLKIGIMGCIVNGPGEMADADYGYVGAAKGHISLYRGKECVKKNVPQEDAVQELINILKEDKVWKEPDV